MTQVGVVFCFLGVPRGYQRHLAGSAMHKVTCVRAVQAPGTLHGIKNKINLDLGPVVPVPEIKLIRTDTTLDLSQKAEKVCLGAATPVSIQAFVVRNEPVVDHSTQCALNLWQTTSLHSLDQVQCALRPLHAGPVARSVAGPTHAGVVSIHIHVLCCLKGCGKCASADPTLAKMMRPTYPRRSSSTTSLGQRARTRSVIAARP